MFGIVTCHSYQLFWIAQPESPHVISLMRIDCAVSRMKNEQIVMRPIVDRMTTDAFENITFPFGR